MKYFDVITALVRSTREGTVFTGVCLFTSGWGSTFFYFGSSRWGYPLCWSRWGYPFPRSRQGDTLFPDPGRRYPFPGLGGGVPPFQVQVGVPPSQVWIGGSPSQGIPSHQQDGVPTCPRLDGVPPVQDWMGYHTPIRRQSSIASTSYVAGGMPLAFMQEDFLVSICFIF